MKVLFDHQIFELQKFGGISRYFFELMRELSLEPGMKVDLSLRYSNNQYIRDSASHIIAPLKPQNEILAEKNKNFLLGKSFRGRSALFNLIHKKTIKSPDGLTLNKEESIAALKKGEFDVFHPTYYDDYFLDYIGEKPFVVTVYDLIHQIFPEFLMGDPNSKKLNLLQKASKIISISHSTKSDLVNLYGIQEEKIIVTHLASSLGMYKNEPMTLKGLPEKYILFVGQRWIYKNFYFLVEVFNSLPKQFENIHIVCTGSEFSEQELQYFRELGIEDRLHQYFANDEELKYLYSHAECFVFPTMYEGFGIPILEAFENSCPTILSNTSSLPEVGGEGAIYFEPKSVSSMKNALINMLSNQSLREELKEKAKVRAAHFAWSNTAKSTIDVYNRCLE